MATDTEYDECSDYGEYDVKKIYNKVKTWEDLIHTNIDFLHGVMPETFYYGAPFHDKHYEAGTYKLENDLIRLHETYAIFTCDGQHNQLKPPKKQRGFLKFACLPELGHKLVPKLLKMPSIFTFVKYYSDAKGLKFYKNIPKRVVLTPPDTNFWLDEDEYAEIESQSDDYSNIQKLFSGCYHVFITFREFPKSPNDPEITTVLLNILQELGK